MALLRSASMALVCSLMRLRSAAAALAMLCTTLVSIPILVVNIFLARLSELAVAVTAEVVDAARALEAAMLAFCTLAIFSYTALVAWVRSFAMAMRLRLLRERAWASLVLRSVARAFTSAEAAALF